MGFGNPDGNSDDEDAEDSKTEAQEDSKGVFDGLGAFTRRQKAIAVCEFLQIAADFVDGSVPVQPLPMLGMFDFAAPLPGRNPSHQCISADQVLAIRLSDGPHFAMTMESQRSFNEMKTVVEAAITDVIKRHKTLRTAKKRADEALFEDPSSPTAPGSYPDSKLTWKYLFQDLDKTKSKDLLV